MSALITTIKHCTCCSNKLIGKPNEQMASRFERCKLAFFSDDMTIYIRDPVKFTERPVETNKRFFNKTVHYEIYVPKINEK